MTANVHRSQQPHPRDARRQPRPARAPRSRPLRRHAFLQLEQAIDAFAVELDVDARFFQTNHEGEFIEELHRVVNLADAAIINAGAWSHYSRAIGDALQFAGVPAVEVHLSDVMAREEWRRVSVLSDGCVATIAGKGVDGYRDALVILKRELGL